MSVTSQLKKKKRVPVCLTSHDNSPSAVSEGIGGGAVVALTVGRTRSFVLPARTSRAGRRLPQPRPGRGLAAVPPAWDQQGEEGPSEPAAPPTLSFRGSFTDSPAPLRAADRRKAGSPGPCVPPPGASVPRQYSGRHGQRGLGDGEWEPLFVSTEKVWTRFRSHCHGNRLRR